MDIRTPTALLYPGATRSSRSVKTLVALLVPGFVFYCMSRRRFISPVALASHLQSIRCLSISRWLVSRTRAYRNGGTRIGLGLQIYTSLVDGCKRAYAYVTAMLPITCSFGWALPRHLPGPRICSGSEKLNRQHQGSTPPFLRL